MDVVTQKNVLPVLFKSIMIIINSILTLVYTVLDLGYLQNVCLCYGMKMIRCKTKALSRSSVENGGKTPVSCKTYGSI